MDLEVRFLGEQSSADDAHLVLLRWALLLPALFSPLSEGKLMSQHPFLLVDVHHLFLRESFGSAVHDMLFQVIWMVGLKLQRDVAVFPRAVDAVVGIILK